MSFHGEIFKLMILFSVSGIRLHLCLIPSRIANVQIFLLWIGLQIRPLKVGSQAKLQWETKTHWMSSEPDMGPILKWNNMSPEVEPSVTLPFGLVGKNLMNWWTLLLGQISDFHRSIFDFKLMILFSVSGIQLLCNCRYDRSPESSLALSHCHF